MKRAVLYLRFRYKTSQKRAYPTTAAIRREWAKEHATELVGYIRGYISGLAWLYEPANKDAAIALFREHLPQMSRGRTDLDLPNRGVQLVRPPD